MGNWHQNQASDQLQYYTTIQNSELGQCEIYTSTKFPRCFIAKIQRSLESEEQFQIFQKIENQQNIYLLSLYGYQLGKNCKCESDHMVNLSVTSFWEHLGFSLEELIENRKRLKVRFQESELWHVVKGCLLGYSAFSRNGVYYDFMSNKVMVNHDGRVRLSWTHLQPKNAHLNFYKAFHGKSDMKNMQQYYSPEQLWHIAQQEFTYKINFERVNIFSLGMMVLHCAMLQNPIFRIYRERKVDYQEINRVMVFELEKDYSKQFLTMLGSMLHQDSWRRSSFQGLYDNYSKEMKGEFHLKMVLPSCPQHKKISINRHRHQGH